MIPLIDSFIERARNRTFIPASEVTDWLLDIRASAGIYVLQEGELLDPSKMTSEELEAIRAKILGDEYEPARLRRYRPLPPPQ